MIKEYQFSFDELNINVQEIFELMADENGFIPEPFQDMTHELLLKNKGCKGICGGYQIVEIKAFIASKKEIILQDSVLHIHPTVYKQIKNATKAAVFLCTAGKEISELSSLYMSQEDYQQGYIADIIGSVTVEKAMDQIHLMLEKEMLSQNQRVTNRYSPGYCGWPVSNQRELFNLLPPHFCHVHLTDSSLMQPIKSVSGIIGIGTEVKNNPYTCKMCNAKNCIYGKSNKK